MEEGGPAGVLHSPFNIWNSEMRGGTERLAHAHQMYLHLQRVIGPVYVEHSLRNYIGRAVGLRHLSTKMLGMKEDGGIAFAFEHILLDLLVAAGVSGVNGGGIHQQFSLRKRRIGIDGKCPAFELKRSTDIPEQIAHLKANLRRGGIEMNFNVTCGNRG